MTGFIYLSGGPGVRGGGMGSFGQLVNCKRKSFKNRLLKGKGDRVGPQWGLNILLAINRDKSSSLNTETTKGTPCFFIRICGKNIKIY